MTTLFSLNLPELKWIEFPALGFTQKVSGVVTRTEQPPCCGVPLGGISTGCLDIDPEGVYGFSSIFNPVSKFPYREHNMMPRKLQLCQPIFGLSTGGKTWVLARRDIIEGGNIPVCTEPFFFASWSGKKVETNIVVCPTLPDVEPANEIYYWGHYPVADLEYETNAPVSVGVRAWSPLLPGDAASSNIPAAVFEVHLSNKTDQLQKGTLAMNFPGPDAQEALSGEFTRTSIDENFKGLLVNSLGGVNYLLGVIGSHPVRFGCGLNVTPSSWSRIASELPQPAFRDEHGNKIYLEGSCSAALDFTLKEKEEQVVNFLLTWYAPTWQGKSKIANEGFSHCDWYGIEWAGDTHYFTHMYAARYGSALEVARRMVVDHQSLLKRILSWQEVIYQEKTLPPWLRDSLINNLHLIAEDSYWAQARPPLGDWAYPNGVFALNESPRGCPDLACIPCDWYGNLPIVYFFPELALSTLRALKAYQKEDGEVPFILGKTSDLPDMATPGYFWQVSLNGMCYVDLIDRVWQSTGDDRILKEFYKSVKKCNTFTINLKKGPGGPISMPEIGGMEWFEHGEWAGMAAHMGGLRLAELKMMERMAEAIGDYDYVKQCQTWFADGSRAMENELWAGAYYLNFYEKETGKRSDDVMAFQLDGEWTAKFHGLPGVFQPDRVRTALNTIRDCNVALAPEVGAVSFCRPDGIPLPEYTQVAKYGSYAMFTPEVVVLAMTYIYSGETEFGLDLAHKHWENLVLRKHLPWDMPNIVSGDNGDRLFGTDYYQDMMLWALPVALEEIDIKTACKQDNLIHRIIWAAKGEN